MRHSIAQLLSGIITLALFTGTAMPTLAQGNLSTGIAITVADWLEPWEPNGGWFAATAGATIEKMPVPVAESTQRMAP